MTVLSKARLYISYSGSDLAIEVTVQNLPIFPTEYDVTYHLKGNEQFCLGELEINSGMGIQVKSKTDTHSHAVNICMNATCMSEHTWQDLLSQCLEHTVDSRRYPHEIIFDL